MARYSHLIAFLFLQLLISVSSANSQDRVFNYTYQSTVLSPGQFEIEVWNTLRWGRESYYQRLDQRFEFETGIARNLQTAFYVNLKSSSSSHSSGSVPATVELESETELSFSNEWKFKLLDPVADPFGVALYAEYSLSSLGVEFEPRLIVDKVLDRTIIAFNASAEFESETEIEPDGTEARKKEAEVDLNLAAAVRIAAGVYLGLETFNRSSFSDGELHYSALYAGPTISYASNRFWVNLTLMPQLTAFKGATLDGLALDDAERYQTRLLFSYAL